MPKLLVNIDVDDTDRAVAFYTAAFDLRVGRRFGSAAVELLGAEAPMWLLKKESATAPFPAAAQTRDYARHWTPVHFDFAVDDINAAVARAVAAGAKLETDVQSHSWGRMAVLA